mgnify:FL=1
MKSYINKSKLFFDIQKVFGIILFVIGCLGTMDAQLVVPFAKTPDQIFSVKGDYTMFGNTSLIRMPYADVGQNGNSDMVYVDVDSDNNTWNSSSANFDFAVEDGVNPNCTQILYAALYWTGRANNGGTAGTTVEATRIFNGATQNRTFTKNEIKLKYGNGTYQNITGSFIANPPTDYYQIYSCYADVTSFVQSKGSGNYTVADMALVQGNADGVGYFGCWAMVVVYQNSKMKTKNIAIFQGHAFNSTNNVVDIPIVGFQAVQSGDVNVKLGFLAGEGDRELTGDYAKIQELNTGNFKSLVHSQNTTNNFFNSSINTGGNARNPSYLNNYGIDVAMFYLDNGNDNNPSTPAVNNVIGNGQTSTTIRVGTTSDIYSMSVMVFGVDAYQPETDEVIKLTAIDGAPPTMPYTCTPGQELTYCVDIKNTGTEPIKNYKLSVPIPSNADFVAGSVTATVNPLAGTPNTPKPVYNAATRSLEWDFGGLPLPSDPSTILANFCFKLKATTNCLLLNNACGQDIPVTGYANGTGVVTNTNIVNQQFILGYVESGECSNEEISGILNTHIDASAYSTANCGSGDLDGILDLEIVQSPSGYPVANVIPYFPPGTHFYSAYPVVTGTIEYTSSNPFPAVDGTVVTYWAVPPGVNACPIKIILTCVNNCSFSVVCGNQPTGNYDCKRPIPGPVSTLAQFNNTFGASQGQNPCHPIKMKVIEDSNFNPCTSIQYDRTYRIYQDDNGNGQYDSGEPKVDCIKTYVWFRDQTLPHYSCDPQVPVFIGCRNNGPTAQDAITAADYTDNCTATNLLTIVATPQDITSTTPCSKIQNWKVEATDACGNHATVIVQIKWTTDTEAPVFADGSPKTIDLGCNPTAPNAAKAISDAGSASDNCGTPTMSATGGSVTGTCSKSQTWTVKAKDGCDNTATRTITYTWKSDTQKPTFSNCQSGQIILLPGTNPPTAADAIAKVGTIADNCTAYNDLIIEATGGGITGGGCKSSQSWTVTATDQCGNKQTCTFILTWGSDPIPPTFGNCPSSSIDLGCNPTLPTTADAIAAVGQVNDNSGSVTVTVAPGSITGNCTKNQNFVVTATDGCGNTASCTVKYSWKSDTEGPVFAGTPPTGGVELGCLGQGGATAQDAKTAAGAVSDNCTASGSIVVTAVGGAITGECHKTQDWTVTAKDGCNNTTVRVVTLKWSFDDQNPVFENCPTAPIDLGCNPVNLPTAAWIQDLVNILPDNCGQVTKEIVAGPITGTCNKQQKFTVTATDNCGNIATCTVTYKWKDDLVPPTFANCPTVPIVLDAGVNPNAEMAITAVGVISDNCTSNPVVTTTYQEDQGFCGTIKIYNVKATDECGNFSVCQVRYTTEGFGTPPVFVNPPLTPFNLGCNPKDNELPTTTQAVEDAGDVTDDNQVVSVIATAGPITGTCNKAQVFTVQATDDCGNVTTVYVTYTWKNDKVKPVFTNCPTTPITVNDINTINDQLAINSAGTPTDNCGILSITADSSHLVGPCGPTVVYTVTATDTCGNSANCVVYFKTNDGSQPPVFENCPKNPFDLGCNPETLPTEGAVAEGAGNVTDDGEIVSILVTPGEITGEDCDKEQVFTVTATDDCGNQSSCLVTYIWTIDTIKPTFPDLPRSEVDLGCNPPSTPDSSAVMGAIGQIYDNCTIETINVSPDDVMGDDCSKSQKWYITAIDHCGNQADTFITFIWRTDLVPPTITCPVYNGSTECSDDAPGAYTTLGEFIAAGGSVDDNCTSDELLIFTKLSDQISGNCATGTHITRVYQVEDECGNKATCQQIINIIDNTPPVVTTGPETPLSFTCASEVPAPSTDGIVAVDNCSNVTITYVGDVKSNETCTNKFTITRTYKATDECGNSTNIIQIINVNDNVPPVIVCPPSPTGTQCGGSIPPPYTTATEFINAGGTLSDNCTGGTGNIVTLTFVSDVTTPGNCANSLIVTRTYKATDACGNTSTATQTINVADNTPPSITAPNDVTVTCASDVPTPNIALVVVSDNCSESNEIVVTFVGDVISNQSCANKYTITRTYKAVDACGNTATDTQIITVNDNVPPVIVAPPPITGVQCASGVPAAYSNLSQFISAGGQASDNCSGSVTISLLTENITPGNCANQFVLTRTYKATDVCGNSSTATQTITVYDNTPPVITVPSSLTVTCASDVPAVNINAVSATDNCSGNVVITHVSDVIANQSCVNKFTVQRTYMATDICGNSSTGVQIINVNDNIPPVIIAPPAITGIQCGGEIPPHYNSATEFIAAGGSLSDNCTGQGNVVTLTFVSETTTPGNCPNSFVVTRTYKATDACGNTSTTQHVINVSDTTPPSITAPAPVNVVCASDVPAPNISLVTVSDNCSNNDEITVVFVSDVIYNQECAHQYTISRTYKATDECGNYKTATQMITVNDNVPPIIVSPPNITGVQCSSEVPAPYANFSQFIAAGGEATDNCSGAVVITLFGESIVPGDCANRYVLTRVYQAMDVCGNTATATQTITVFDNTPPIVTVPGPLTVSCAEEVPAANTDLVIATDNCAGNITITVAADVITNQTCANKYTISRTYTATDICGNATSGTQTITVNDVTPPVIIVPANLNLTCSTDVPPADINLVSATDNCIGEVTITHVGDEIITQQCAHQFVLHRTYKATDVCGNFTLGVQVITVNDNVPPVIICPNDELFVCATDVPAPNTALVQATDNCVGEVTITHVGDVIVDQQCANQFELHRTYMATDVCGNTSTCTQIIAVADLIPPTIECPAPLSFKCASEVPIPDINSVVASDNCEGVVTIQWIQDVISEQTCENKYIVTRTYMATDVCGNSSTCNQIITVNDDVPPVIHINDPEFGDVPNGGTVTLQCYAMNPDWVLPTLTSDEISVTDNCGQAIISMTQTVSEGDCMNNGYFKKIHVVISAQDVCQNESTFTFDILIVDEIPPVFTVIPQDATVSCSEASTVKFEIKAEDECECANITFADQIVNGSCAGSYTIYRTYTAKDCCGNESTYTQKISVVDDVAPIIVPLNGTLATMSSGDTIVTYCGADEYPQWLNLPVNQLIKGVDACSSNPTINLQVTEENQDACWLYGYSKQYNVLFTATDACGNTSELRLYVQVQDTTAPQVMYINDFVCEDDNTWPVAFDNCSSLTYDTNDTPVTGECNGSQNFIRTWTIRDACQNTTYATQYVVKNDHKAPVIHMINSEYAGHLSGDIVTIECGDWKNISKDEALTWIEAEDKCDYITLDFNSREIKGNCLTDGFKTMYEYTWTAADYCGNQSTYVLFFQLSDNTPPVFNTNLTVVNVDCENSIPAVKATDNCSNVNLTVERTKFELGCPNNFSLDEVYTATDACGNTSTFTRTVNVVDTTGPVIYVPDAICETDLGQSNAIAVDYCTNKPAQVTAVVDHNIVNCNGSSYYTITYTAADYCGNVTNKVQKVIVEDNTPPVLSFSYDFQTQFNIVDNTIYTGCDNFDDFVNMIDKSAAVIASDECGNIITPTFTETEGETTCEGDYVTKEHFFKWTATDACGNTSNLDLKVVLEALEQFDFSFIGADTTVYCNQVVALPTVLPELNCTQVDLSSTINYGQAAPDGSYIEERTYTYTNLCGEEVSHTQIINHSFQTNMSCNISVPTEVLCNSSNNLFTVNVTGGTAPYTYYWEILNGWCHIIGGQNTPTVQISISFKTLHLKVTVTDANGCTTTCYVEVDCNLENPGITIVDTNPDQVDILKPIGQVNAISDISLRPNPTSSQVYLEFESALSEGVVVNISDQFGKVVLSRKLTSTKGFNSQLFETNTLTAGLYQVSLISSDKIKTLQLIKVK